MNGERKAKYKRLLNMKISGEAIERLEEEGFRGPVRKRQRLQPDEAYDSREYQQSLTYYAYAKDICEHYNFDRNKYRLCVKEKRFVAITKSDFAKLKEDLQLLDDALKTVLATHQDYFRERFVEGLFQVLTASGASTLTDLKEDWLKSAGAMVRAMKDLDKETRDALVDAVGLLVRSNVKVLLEDWQQESQKKRREQKKRENG